MKDLEPNNIKRMNFLLNNAMSELNLVTAHEMLIFNDIGTEILICKENSERL